MLLKITVILKTGRAVCTFPPKTGLLIKRLARIEPIKRAHIKPVLCLTVEDSLQLAPGSSKDNCEDRPPQRQHVRMHPPENAAALELAKRTPFVKPALLDRDHLTSGIAPQIQGLRTWTVTKRGAPMDRHGLAATGGKSPFTGGQKSDGVCLAPGGIDTLVAHNANGYLAHGQGAKQGGDMMVHAAQLLLQLQAAEMALSLRETHLDCLCFRVCLHPCPMALRDGPYNMQLQRVKARSITAEYG